MKIKNYLHLALSGLIGVSILGSSVFANVGLESTVSQIKNTSSPYTSQCEATYQYAIYEGQSFRLYHTQTPNTQGSTWEYFPSSKVTTYNHLNIFGNTTGSNTIGGNFPDFKYKSNGRLGTNHFGGIGGGIQTALSWKQNDRMRAVKPSPNTTRTAVVGQAVHTLDRKQIESRGGSYFSMTTYNFDNNNAYTQNANPDTYYNLTTDDKCQNFYVAKCGDGIRDDMNKAGGSNTNGKQGMQTSNGFVEWTFPSATIIAEQCDGTDGVTPGYTCNAQCQLVAAPQMADLSVTKTVNNTTPTVGSNVIFTMVLNNAGPNIANNVTLTDILPSGYIYVSHTTSNGTYNSSNGIRNVGTINVNQNMTLTITAQVKSAGTYLNTIEVTSSDKADPDSTPNNHIPTEDDQASATVNPLQPAPTCTLTVNPTSIVSGGLASVSRTINGNFLSPTWIYVNPQILGSRPKQVSTPTGTTYASPTAPGTYTFTMTVVDPISGLSGICSAILNVGQNNPILTIQKTLLGNAPAYYSGDQIGFRINFQNIGSGTATNVVLTDILPSSLSYVSASIYGVSNQILNVGMSGANPVITFNNFNLAPGASGYMIITGTLNTNSAGNNRTNYTDIYASNFYPPVSATALFPVGITPSNNVVFTKIGNKSAFQLGENFTFTITTTNNGPSPINDLTITDIRPNPSCITYNSRSSPDGFVNNASMSRFRSGTLAVGQTVTLTLSGTISNSPSCAANYNNIANLTYYVYGELQNKTSNFPFTVGANQCQSLTTNSTVIIIDDDEEANAQFTCNAVNGVQGNIKIDCGNGQILNGFGSTYTDTCNYGDNPGTYNVVCYVENTTNNNCAQTIIVDEGMLGYCGNGIREGIEKCDLGEDDETIGNYLDNNGLLAPERYRNKGYSCENCAIKKQGYYEAPACNGISTTLSVQKGEVLPFRWELEGNNIVDEDDCEDADNGDVLEDSIQCTFKVFNGKTYLQQNDDYSLIKVKDCNIDERDGHEMFDYFEDLADEIYHSLENAFGKYYFLANNTSEGFLKDNTFGEYKLVLDKVEYDYCDGDDEENGTVIDRVCEVNFAVTKPYLMQKSLFGATPKTTTDINLDQFWDMNGEKIINKTDLSSIMKVDAEDYAGGTKMDGQIASFINKYTKLSTVIPTNNLHSISDGNITKVRKVPSQQIYIIEGNGTLTLKQLNGYFNKPFTMIVKGMDLVVEGSLKTNGMFVVQGGKISFKEDPDNRCESTQSVQGIFISNLGFGVGDITLNISNYLDRPRCNRGGLNVKGVLIGDNIDDLVLQRRSQLNDRFRVHTSDEEKIKIERRNKIFNGASVLIEYSPSLRGNLPPGASDFTKVLEVYKK